MENVKWEEVVTIELSVSRSVTKRSEDFIWLRVRHIRSIVESFFLTIYGVLSIMSGSDKEESSG